ncbi:pre-mRNA-processing protein 40C-like isoform X2 [Tripterygium wilfordii]|uniref:pre-mRNA-processing protein 40C-like isoform X2 n=1 Tax=Tripterygium wilfordii TaxID=458696 RepID=UPI0018F85213|nr:pre-mRNA-processing protein 40C-like isoform X2 [Tripterygium wilfordii]
MSTPPPGGPSNGSSTPTATPSGNALISNGPSFSYSVSPSGNSASGGSQQPSSSSVSPIIIYPQSSASTSSSGPSLSSNFPQASVGFISNPQFQSITDASAPIARDSTVLSTSTILPLNVIASSSSTVAVSTTPNLGPATLWTPTTLSFPVPPRPFGTPGIPGPSGLAFSTPVTVPSAISDSSSVLRHNMSMAPDPSNSAVQQPIYPAYPSLPAMGVSPQAHWSYPPQMGGFHRPPFLPHPAGYPGSFPSPMHVMPLPLVPSSDSQPPGVSSLAIAGSITAAAAAPGNQFAGPSGMQMQTELPPGIDNRKLVHDAGIMERVVVSEQAEPWTSHKTDTGVIYYYNAVTGQSTYEKPPGFKGASDKVSVQPTPVSMEHLAGTDWALVSTNDGKKYYYNSKTKLSSWQIPTEVAELRKKQDVEVSGEHPVPLSNTSVPTDKVSAPVSLTAPAVSTGGRDSIALRNPGALGSSSSSALDLVKKKLQDYGAPITSAAPSVPAPTAASELNGSSGIEGAAKGLQNENSKDKLKEANDDGNLSDSSSESEDTDSGPTKEECIIQFKEMLKERRVAPFSKWEKELPKIVFDPRFKAIPSQAARRSIFEHYVKTRAEEERKEKRAAQKAAIEGFKQLLEESSEEIDQSTDYQTFRRKRGSDPRFEALDRKDREHLLNERVLLLKRAAEEKAKAIRAVTASGFKSMLHEKGDITVHSRWSRVKDALRNDPRYKSVKHEDREVLFNEYISELKAEEEEAEQKAKVKRDEQEKLKERERELRKRKEREEHEMERVRLKVRRKEAVATFQALLMETIKDPQASWTESKPKLEKDPQGRATNPELDPSDMEKLFREHVKMLLERCVHEFRALLAEVITPEAAVQETGDGKTVLNSWSTAKRVLKLDPRYNKMPRKEREALWRRHSEELLRKQKSAVDQIEEKHSDAQVRSSFNSGRFPSGSRRTNERR